MTQFWKFAQGVRGGGEWRIHATMEGFMFVWMRDRGQRTTTLKGNELGMQAQKYTVHRRETDQLNTCLHNTLWKTSSQREGRQGTECTNGTSHGLTGRTICSRWETAAVIKPLCARPWGMPTTGATCRQTRMRNNRARKQNEEEKIVKSL